MKQFVTTLAVLAALIAPATAQQFPLTLPANTVYGRLGASSGPGQAIPFATLRDRLAGTPTTGLFTGLGATGQSYFGPIAAGGDKAVTISGAYSKITPTGNQNLMLISNNAVANNPLALSAQVIGNATSSLRRAELQVSEFGLGTYRDLALQPLGGNVAIGLAFGTAAGATLDVRGTADILKPGYTLTDASSWGYRHMGFAANLDGSAGPRYSLTIQNTITGPTGYASYQTSGILVQGLTGDISGGGADRDYVAIDARGAVSSTNALGRAWGLISFAEIQSGGVGDGLLVSHEVAIVNNGTSQTSVNTTTSKYNSNYTSAGTSPVTAAINIADGGTGWHKILYANPASISSGTGAGFIELLGAFTVKKTGYTDIGGSGLTAPPLGIQAENASAGLAIDIRGRAADGIGCVRFLSNDVLSVYGQLCSNSTPELVTATQIVPNGNGTINSGKSTAAWLGVYTRNLFLNGSTSGALTVKAPAAAGANTLTLPAGTTDFSATGGTAQVVKQTSAGGAFTVATIATSEITTTTTNDNAAAGKLGEYIRSSTAETAAVSNTSTVTITIASPAVVTWGTTIPFTGNAVINFTTTGALPTGLVAGTNYYVIGSSISGNTFQLATSIDNAIAGTAINTSGTQSGTQTGSPRATLTSSVAVNIAGISLTAGDWDVSTSSGFLSAGTTSITALVVGMSTSSEAASYLPGMVFQLQQPAFVPGAGAQNIYTVGPTRFSLSATTTIYAVANTVFTVSALDAWGGIWARRVR